MIIGFVIWSAVAVLFLGIGIWARKAREAVGFFTSGKPPVVKDVSRYNCSVSNLWIIAAVILEIMGVPLLFMEQNSPAFIFVIFGAVAWCIGMMASYVRIEAKYRA